MLPLSALRLRRPSLVALAALFTLALSPSAWAQDAADLLVRTTRLENQLRQMSGQIEQLQFHATMSDEAFTFQRTAPQWQPPT